MNSPSCKHAQQPGLRLDRHIADLVEEQCSALRLLEPSDTARRRAGEGAFFVAEQFALDQLARDRGHVDRDKRAVAPLAVIVQRASDQFLAGAALAHDRHGEVGAHQPGEHAVDLLHRRRAADQRQLVFDIVFGRQRRGIPGGGQRPLDDADELAQVERLGQIFEGATLGRLDRGHQRVLRAHDDDPQLRADLLDARDQVEAVLVRHDDVGDDEVALAVRNPSPQGRGVAGHPHIVSEPDQRLVEHHPDRAIIIGHQDRRGHHPLPSCATTGRNTRNTVRRGWLSNSMTPPWSPITLATNARPRPVPFRLVVTNGSKR